MVDSLSLILLVTAALVAFAARRNPVICLAALAILPVVPALLRYELRDASLTVGNTDSTAAIVLLAAINYGGVWGGFAAGLMFDVFNRRSKAVTDGDLSDGAEEPRIAKPS